MNSTPGATLRIIHAGHTRVYSNELADIEDFVVQPAPAEYSDRDKSRLEGAYRLMGRTLRGEFAATSDDYFFLLAVDGRYVSHLAYSVSRRSPTIGLISFVLTRPDCQRRGFSTHLCAVARDHFTAHGGRAMYLGTSNPTARRIYIKCGFRNYNGQTMRWVTDFAAEAGFDESYFERNRDLSIRPVEWGDAAPAVCLYTNRCFWIVRDFSEGILVRAEDGLTRTSSIFYSLFGRSEVSGNSMYILHTGADRLVGCVSTIARAGAAESVLEVMLHPNFAMQAAPLLRRWLEAGRKFVGYAARGDEVKQALLRDLGFHSRLDEADPFILSFGREP